MPRQPRIDPPDGWHHVMNRGVNHQTAFFGDVDRVEFGRLLGVIHDEFGVETHAYCLLDNHFHLLLHCPNAGLSTAMQTLGAVFTRHVNDRVGRDGPIFRGRFHSRHIEDDSYLLNVVRYIHRNALDVAGVTAVDSYRWSSHRTYLGARKRPHWLRTAFILDQFAGSTDAFRHFVEDDAWQPTLAGRVHPHDLLAAIGLVIGQRQPQLPGSSRPYERVLAMLLGEELDQAPRSDLHVALGIDRSGAASTALYRSRKRQAAEPIVDEMLRSVRSLVGAASHLGSDPKCDAA